MDANVVRTLNEGPMGPQGPVKVNHCIMNNAAGYGPVVRMFNYPISVSGSGGGIEDSDDDIDGDLAETGSDTVVGGSGDDSLIGGD